MGSLNGTQRLEAPLELVWQLLAKAELRPRWELGVVAVEDVTVPLDRIGTTWTEVRKLAGVTMRQRFRVTDVQMHSVLEFTGTSPAGGRTVIHERLQPSTDGRTIKTYDVDYRLPGGILGTALDTLFMHRKLIRDSPAVDERFRALVTAAHDTP